MLPIQEKLTIPREILCLPRRRLLDRLAENLDGCEATIIVGRAGTGKTILAADFVCKVARRVTWYKVDAPESDFRLFLRYLTAGIRLSCPEFDDWICSGQSMLQDASTMAEILAGELQTLRTPLLLVIDDLHLLYDAVWLTPFFHRLMPLLPLNTHLLLLARSLPPAPLWRLRSKQRLAVLGEAELAFTREEAQELFAAYGLSAVQASIALAESRGRGSALTTLAGRARGQETVC